MDYTKKSLPELKELCRNKGVKGFSTKKKAELIEMLKVKETPVTQVPTQPPVKYTTPVRKSGSKTALSLFSGAGGDTCGLEAAGWKVSHFSEFNAKAVDTHKAAFPSSELLTGTDKSIDIKKIPDETFVTMRGNVGLVFAGFPCFVAGTKVLTDSGYKNIEDVVLEDKLLTHTGKFKKILNLQQKEFEGSLYDIRVKYHQSPLTGTPEHPFYVRTRTRTWNNTLRKYEYSFDKAEWKTLENMTKNDFCGMVINSDNITPSFNTLVKKNSYLTQTIQTTLDSKDMWYMIGYFVGDGWVQDSKKTDGRLKHTIFFAINDNDVKEVSERIRNVIPITEKGVRSGSCSKWGCSDTVWYEILKKFGKYAHGKKIPEWVQSAPKEFIEEFLNGYIKADGCYRKQDIRITTVSHDLATGVQRLFLKLGHIVSIQKTKRAPTHVICGRTVNQRDTYEVSIIKNKSKQHSGFIEDNYAWMAPASIVKKESETSKVYNFEVEEDNSYIVENTIVHNCQGFSHAGKKKSDDPRNELVHEFVRVAKLVEPEWIVGENVRGLLSRKGVYPPGSPARPIIEIIKELFERIGYKITWRVVDATEVGVPQLRKRLIIIGHKGSEYPQIPWNELPTPAVKPTIRSLLGSTLEGAVELPEVYKPSEQDARFWIKTGETNVKGIPHPNLVRLVAGIRNLSSKEMKEQNKTEKEQFVEPKGLISFGTRAGGYHGQVLDPDAPCKTIICAYNQCPRLFVGLHNASVGKYWVRCLTPEECGLIQGFPADYAWQGSVKDKITQIGNAVPPPLATAIANLIEKASFSSSPQQIGVDAVGEEDSDDE